MIFNENNINMTEKNSEYYNDKFKMNLKQGKKYEKIALNYLDYDTVKHVEGKFKDYDFIITKDDTEYKYEVKSDRQASITGNLAIEYEYNNKPSGISATTSDYLMYFIVFEDRDECYNMPTNELREIVKSCKKVVGGDKDLSKMYLVNKSKLHNYLIKNKKNNIVYNIEDMTDEVKPLTYNQRLINEFKDNTYTKEQIEEIINSFSKQEYENKKKKIDEMPFGKYKFKKVSDIAKFDKNYLKWLSKQDMLSNYEDLKNEIKKHI